MPSTIAAMRSDLKRPEEALASYDKALAIRPDYAEALSNRGNALQDLKRPEEALASYDKALAIRPDYAEALSNRGLALQDLKRPEEALASYDKALAIRPDYPEALFNRGLHALLIGNFSAGWRGYDGPLGSNTRGRHASFSPPIQTGRAKTLAESGSLFTKNRAWETSSKFHGF